MSNQIASTSSNHNSSSNGEIYAPIPRHLSIIPSLSNLSLTDSPLPSRYPKSSTSSSVASFNTPEGKKDGPRRAYTATPSSTSVSSNEDEDEAVIDVKNAKSWLNMASPNKDVKGKGKAKQVEFESISMEEGLANRLPPEILIQILKLLPDNKDLLSTLLVSKSWCLCTFSLIWTKPQISSIKTLASLIRTVSNPTLKKQTTLPYALSVKRIHLSHLSSTLNSELFMKLTNFQNLERLTISNCNHLSSTSLITVIRNLPELISVDFSNLLSVNDLVIKELSEGCKNLQAINLNECKFLGDEGVLALANGCTGLRRAKFSKCHRLTSKSLIPLIQNCHLLLELDLQDVISINDSVVYSIFLNLTYLRELKLNNCTELTEKCIPNLEDLKGYSEETLIKEAQNVNLYPQSQTSPKQAEIEDEKVIKKEIRVMPKSAYLDHLRIVDFTGCTNLGDLAIENLISNSTKLRTLTLTKCQKLTNLSLESIERLGKHLHYLHLGHVKLITDAGVIRLAKACTRLRYIDLACCDLLTDESISELGVNMPKLRRIGLVKVVKITDETLYALVERSTALERIHLSYCDNLSAKAVSHMLNRLPHLKHLSLTGVTSFKKKQLQVFCRAPPESFNDHQRGAFCVFSGNKVDELRRYLNEVYLASTIEESDSTSTRRNSGSSSTSSITVPGTSSPPFINSNSNQPWNTTYTHAYPQSYIYGPGYNSSPNAGNGYVYRRGSAPTLRGSGSGSGIGLGLDNIAVPGLPSMAFANPTPNFLNPPTTSTIRTSNVNNGANNGLGLNISSRIRESGSIAMSSREGSLSSIDEPRHSRRERERERNRPMGPRDRETTLSNDHHHNHQRYLQGQEQDQSHRDEITRQSPKSRDVVDDGIEEQRVVRDSDSPDGAVSPNNGLNASALGMKWFGWGMGESGTGPGPGPGTDGA
ncbi:uncharacterized protein I206_101044 [Kwoniella pini CBS 10737]|uniref:Uncharacterized protein n=1 Tax=Kwoniella pini CBS 10737 TaxID=1296096 RepID=A0A1B9IC13_9TREE|nr:uncharacterized protein I206_00282 [Kwoniella pini CBS 10737]OCF52981.1 hypothetical protein I206_00282 [Kwoniella pini CBS 10737]